MDKLPSPQRVRVHGSGGRGPEIPQTNHWKRRRQTRCGAKEDMRERKRTTGWSMGEMVKWFFFLLMIGQSLVGVTASSENIPSNRRQMEGLQGERKMKESSWVQINQTNFPTMEMRKRDAEGIKMARCTLQTGSAWSMAFACSTRSCEVEAGLNHDRRIVQWMCL